MEIGMHSVCGSVQAKMLNRVIVTVFVFGVTVEAIILCNKNSVVRRINDTASECIPSHLVAQQKVFQKCCPLHYAYDKKRRFCVASKQKNCFDNQSFFKIGLKDCINKRVVDYYNTDAEVLKRDHKIGSYCLDEVFESKEKEIVLRKCEEGDIEEECRVDGARCLRKCCPDHEIYEQSECRTATNVTFNYANFTDKDQIHVLKGRI